jgi:hypothetical protein
MIWHNQLDIMKNLVTILDGLKAGNDLLAGLSP